MTQMTYGVPLVQFLGDEQFRSHTVGGHGDVPVAEIDETGEEARHAHGLSDALSLVAYFADECLDGLGFLVNVHSGFGVGPTAHLDPQVTLIE